MCVLRKIIAMILICIGSTHAVQHQLRQQEQLAYPILDRDRSLSRQKFSLLTQVFNLADEGDGAADPRLVVVRARGEVGRVGGGGGGGGARGRRRRSGEAEQVPAVT